MEKRRENGERREIGKGQKCPPRASFPFSPAPARFISPILQTIGKTKETSAEERTAKKWNAGKVDSYQRFPRLRIVLFCLYELPLRVSFLVPESLSKIQNQIFHPLTKVLVSLWGVVRARLLSSNNALQVRWITTSFNNPGVQVSGRNRGLFFHHVTCYTVVLFDSIVQSPVEGHWRSKNVPSKRNSRTEKNVNPKTNCTLVPEAR